MSHMYVIFFLFQVNNVDVCGLVNQFLTAKKMHDTPLYGQDCEPRKMKLILKSMSPSDEVLNTKNRKKLAQQLINVQKIKCACNTEYNSKFFS